ncbi:MAG: response regulator [Deltaproteobacteria bacterium]|nr:response regulator [Deltaproteobacteria bacterium]
MTEKILFVDDEINILAGFKRQLRKEFAMETALGPEEGLRVLKERGPFAVVVSDLRMPVMDGIAFLGKVRKLYPNTVRMVLSGHADLQTAIKAVNEGNIFRFLTKPCHPETLSKVLTTGIKQFRLVNAEKELLEKTLKGSIKVMTELLSLANPEAFGRSSRIKRQVTQVARFMGITGFWRLETAAMLSQVGFVILPQETLDKLYRGEELKGEEQQVFDMHPVITADLLRNIPRLEEVARIIEYQEKHFDGTGKPKDGVKGEEIPLGSRILKAVLDLDMLNAAGTSKKEALAQMKTREGWYDPAVLRAIEMALGVQQSYEVISVRVRELKGGMILGEDVTTEQGKLLIAKGQEVSQPLVERLKNVAEIARVKEPIRVIVPVEPQEVAASNVDSLAA